jgi:hypothetical protein
MEDGYCCANQLSKLNISTNPILLINHGADIIMFAPIMLK